MVGALDATGPLDDSAGAPHYFIYFALVLLGALLIFGCAAAVTFTYMFFADRASSTGRKLV